MKSSKFFALTLMSLCILSTSANAARRQQPRNEGQTRNEGQEQKIGTGLYSLNAPKGWQCISDKKQLPAKVEVVFIGIAKGQFTPSFNIATEDTDMTVENYVDTAKRYHESQGETICRSLGTIETHEGQAQLLQIDRKTQWGPIRFIQATLIKEKKAFVLTATCLQSDFNENFPYFIKMIQSFAINGT